jgi:flagellar hook-associated protein 1 FlgK
MSVERNKYDSSQLEIGISVDKTVVNKAIVTDSLAGGSLSALVDVRDNLILPAIRELGKLATVIADSFNRQQTLGRDLNGVEGTDIFMDVNDPQLALGRTLNSSDNVTPSVFEVYIRNTNELTADEYDMEYVNDGVNPETLNIYDTDGNLIQTFDAADIANMSAGTALPVSGIGISLAIDTNNMTDGDSFKIRPVNNGANKIEKIMTDPSLIAAADNYLEVGDVTNPNNVVASVYRISDVTNTGFPHPNNVPGTLPDESIQIVVDATGTQYDIQDSAGTSLLGGFQDIPTDQIVEGVGLSVKLDGVLAGGEVFTITHADNANNDNKRFGPGDNTNALIMLGFQSSKNVDNGTNSFSESYADLVTMVGVQTKGREISKDSFQTLLSGAEERLAGVQGVNLDEEAANLIQYQQAYSAAARIITVARETFQTLISAAG